MSAIIRKSIICIFIFTSFCLNAQEYMVETVYPGAVGRTIVREHTYPATISYVESGAGKFFSYADASMTVKKRMIANDIVVNDFYVTEDYVCFCGYKKTTVKEGLVGWFKIADFFTGTGTYYLYHNFDWMVDNVEEFAHIESLGGRRTVLVGNTAGGSALVMGLTGLLGSATGWTYEVGVSTEPTEVINQVCVTNNYVVTTGRSFSHAVETIRILDRSNLFVPLGPFHAIYYYSSYGTGTWTRTTDAMSAALTHVAGDQFAVAERVYTLPLNAYGTEIKVMDALQTLLNPFSAVPVHRLFIQASSSSSTTYEIKDMVYCVAARSLALLTKDFLGSGQSEITEIPLPLPISGFVDYFFKPGKTLQSIVPYNSGADYVCEGHDDAIPTTATCYTKPMGYYGICTYYDHVPVSIYEYQCKRERIDIQTYDGSFDFYEKTVDKQYDDPNDITCQ